MRSMDMTVLGGLPITVEYSMASAEPDVGIFSDYVDEWYITHINGRKVKKCDWLYKRISSSKEEETILDKIYSNEEGDYDDNDYR